VEEFSRIIEKELDYSVEAAHLERFAKQFTGDRTIYVPKVYRELTTARVITLEYVDAMPITDRAALIEAGLNPELIARRGADLTLKQIFTHGFFHADPHPGNIFVLPDNVICLLDFGMMGRLDRSSRERFGELVQSVVRRDPLATAAALLHVTEHDDGLDIDARKLERDLDDFIESNFVTELGELRFGKLLTELLELVRRHQLRIPPEMVTMLKAAATVERVAVQLHPELNMIARARPYVRRLRMDRVRPGRVMREMIDAGGDLLEFARDIPGNLRDILRQAKRGGLKIGFEHRGLTDFMESNERIANRVSFAIVVAALIVGSSVIVHARIPPTWNEIPIVGLIGYLAAGVMGFLLLIGIIRHGRL
jgi:ubiquinone biosynthesis protein